MEHHPMGSLLDVHGLMLASTQIKCQPRTVTFWGYSDGDRGESKTMPYCRHLSRQYVDLEYFSVYAVSLIAPCCTSSFGLWSELWSPP
jgi:hypothetical protein